nr:glyoxylate reductase:hydroxypyruvate [Hymenolepis microstoma]CDS34782.1 glyoxylate reductase:hydroxypyruvate [Hymenolepis microstoma]
MLDVYIAFKLPEKILERLTKFGLNYECWSGPGIPSSQYLIERLKGVKGLICHPGVKIDSAVLNAAGSSLKVVSTMSVGYDHLDIKEMKLRNVRVGYVPDVLTEATAELTVSLLLTVSRRVREASETVRAGTWGAWEPFWMCGKELKNSTVGIFGLGRIGAAVATRLAAFSPSRIIYASSGKRPGGYQPVPLFTKPDGTLAAAEPVSFDELLKESDFLCVCASMCDGLKSVFNDETFGKMKAGAVFVNIARGAMVDQEALFRALTKGIEAGGLWGAGLDVTTPEPLPVDSPLLKLPNCFILPHIASATEETRWLMAERAVDNLVAGLSDEPMPSELKV